MQHRTKVVCLAGLLYPMFPCFADVQITSKYTADGQTTETTTYAKGEKLRYQYGGGVVLLRDCASNRITNIDERNKTFVSLPESATGERNVLKITPTDTGEQKQIFNRTARHIRTTASAGNGGRVETDGWYLDSKDMPSCAAGSGQKDAPSLGYPVSYIISTYKDATGTPTVVSMEVTELVDTPIEQAMFEIPAGYTDAAKPAQPAVQKAPGAVRVGAVAIHNKAAQATLHPAPYEHMVASLREAKIDVVPLPDGSSESVGAKAKEVQCDYVLYTDLTSVDKPATGKLGGFIRKTPGLGKSVTGDAMEAKVDYRLVPVGGGSPALAATATGKTGSAFTFNWKTAVTVASTVTPMFMMARMMGATTALNPNMMSALSSGHGYGASMAGMDPMMNTLSFCLRAGNTMGGPQSQAANPTAVDNAIAAALDQEAQAVLAQLKK